MHLITRQVVIQNAGFDLLCDPPYSPFVFVLQMADWKTKNNNSSTTESELWRNPAPGAFQLQENMSKSDKI